MRSRPASCSAVLAALALMIAQSFPRVALGKSTLDVTGSIQRVDETTCRIQFFMGSVWDPEIPCEGTCCWSSGDVTSWSISVAGPFGSATNFPESCGPYAGLILCWGYPMQFDFAVTPESPSRLVLDFLLEIFWLYRCCDHCNGDCMPGPCGIDDVHSEELPERVGVTRHVTIPARVGDSTALETVTGVEAGSWAVVKQLYRD